MDPFRFVLVCISMIFSSPAVASRNLVVLVGSNVRMPCRTTNEVEWTFVAARSERLEYIYINNLITKLYAPAGRHSVVTNVSTATHELVLRNVLTSDAGTYSCSEEIGYTKKLHTFQLTVIQSLPICSSNVSLDDVLAENDCDMEHDHVELGCSISYHGNVVPVLKWFHSRDGSNFSDESTTLRQPSNDINNSTTFLTFKMKKHLHHTFFYCAIETASTMGKTISCHLPPISATYFFRNDDLSDATYCQRTVKSDGYLNDVNCTANTSSQTCEYTWMRQNSLTSISDNNFKIQSSELEPGTYQCVATCYIRDVQCQAIPICIKLLGYESAGLNKNVQVIVFASCSPILFLLAVVLGVILIYRKYIRRRYTQRRADERGMEMACIVEAHDDTEDPDTGNRPLSDDELACIDGHLHRLINLIKPSKQFLNKLLQEHCITEMHTYRIDKHQTKYAKNAQLISIIKRRSFADLERFKIALRETGQHNALKLLTLQTGSAIEAKVDVSFVNDASSTCQSSDEITELERKVSDLLTEFTVLSQRQKEAIANMVTVLHDHRISLIGASPTGSVIVYFICETFDSIVAFKKLVTSGRMKESLEKIFNCVLDSPSTHVKLIVSFNEEDYNRSVNQARRTLHLEGRTSSSPSISAIPTELAEIILQKASVYLLNIRLKEHLGTAESSLSFESFKHSISISNAGVLLALSSVSYTWLGIISRRPFLRKKSLKTLLALKLLKSQTIVIERLDIEHGFMDRLNESFSTMTNAMLFEESNICRNEEQLQTKLFRNLMAGEYENIMEFLQLLEQTGQSHILNYIISDAEYQPVFGKFWPIDTLSFNRLVAISGKLIASMNPMLSCSIVASDSNAGYAVGESTDDLLETMKGDPKDSHYSGLDDILYRTGCISFNQRRCIGERGVINDKNRLILQLLVKGSVATLYTTFAYLRGTGQNWAINLLTNFPHQDDITFSEMTRVKGITLVAKQVFIVFDHSNEIKVFRFEDPSSRSHEESIIVQGMCDPSDIASPTNQGSIMVSDEEANCLWKITLLNKSSSKWTLPRKPEALSIGCDDNLLVVSSLNECRVNEVEGRIRSCLDVHEMKDLQNGRNVNLPSCVMKLYHAVQISKGAIIISYVSELTKDALVSELSKDGNVVRSLTLSVAMPSTAPSSIHMYANKKDEVFIADSFSNNIFYFDTNRSGMKDLDAVCTTISSPIRVCHFFDDRSEMLFFGLANPPGTVSVLCKRTMTNTRSVIASNKPTFKRSREILSAGELKLSSALAGGEYYEDCFEP